MPSVTASPSAETKSLGCSCAHDCDCLFCKILNEEAARSKQKAQSRIIAENELAYAIFDEFPVNPGHALIIPKRHTADFFDLTDQESEAVFALLKDVRKLVCEKFSPDGFNVGVNVGKAAGQSVFHVHVHLIPRFTGDIENPRGGVRGVIPSRRSY